MKISQWQRYTLCVCAIGGVLVTSPVHKVMAADHIPITVTKSNTDKLDVTTNRILELHSKDGQISHTQHSKVEWLKQPQDGSYGPTTFSIPKIEGYDTPAKGMANSARYHESPQIPLTVYHINYYASDERFEGSQAECQVDLQNEDGQILVRHIYNVPYDRTIRVQLDAPNNAEFIKKDDSQPFITGTYKFNKVIKVKTKNNPAVVHPDNQVVTTDQASTTNESTQTEAVQSNDKGTSTDPVSVKNEATATESNLFTQDKGVMTDSGPAMSVDEGTMTDANVEHQKQPMCDEAVGTDKSQILTKDEASMTEQGDTELPVHGEMTDHSTMTDEWPVHSPLHDAASQTTVVPDVVGQDAAIQTTEVTDKPATSEVETMTEPETTPHHNQQPVEDKGVMTDAITTPVFRNDAMQTLNDTHSIGVGTEEVVVEKPAEKVTTSNCNLDQVTTNHQNESYLVQEVASSPAHSIRHTDDSQVSPQALADLAKYNHPFASTRGQRLPKNEKLPQTGDHTGQLLVACGIALLSVLGLFRTREKH